MKLVVIGGNGLIGSRLVKLLREHGQEAVAASPTLGVNAVTGEGLAEALKGASVVIDVSNAPLREDSAVMTFFETSTRNLLAYGAAAGVSHHVALTVVGSKRMPENFYLRAKIAQENLIKASAAPYSIVRATQFYESLKEIADFSTSGNKAHLPHVLFQPIAADDVAAAMGRIALSPPINSTVEIAGPEEYYLDELIRQSLASRKDSREVLSDPRGGYYGIPVKEQTLLPGDDAALGKIRFQDWLAQGNLQ
ncbi:MAG: SDR family oxidoreductase [Terracidiphilus sp.]